MSKPKEIPPYNPDKLIDPFGLLDGGAERQLEYDKERDEKFFREERSDVIERRCDYDRKTKTWKGKKVYKKGKRVHIAKCHDGSIIANDEANFGLCGMGCLTSYWNIRWDPETGEVIERTPMTDSEREEYYKAQDFVQGQPRSPWNKQYKDRSVVEVMAECKAKLYQHAQQVIQEIGHVPVVSLGRYHELKEKYGDENPPLDLSRFDMEMPDQLIENGTLSGACDIADGMGGHERGRYLWHAVYVRDPHDHTCWSAQAIVARDDGGNAGQRPTPAVTIEEAKAIAEKRGIFVVKRKSEEAETERSYKGERYTTIDTSKDPVICFMRNGKWVDVDNKPLEDVEFHDVSFVKEGGHPINTQEKPMQNLESEIWHDPAVDIYYLKIRVWEMHDGRPSKRGIVFKMTSEMIANMPYVAEGQAYPERSGGIEVVGKERVSTDEPVCNDGRDISVCCQAPTKRVSDTIWICTKCGK